MKIDTDNLLQRVKRGETKALNKYASIVLGVTKRNIKTRKRPPIRAELPTARPQSGWKRAFKYEAARPDNLTALVGATTNKGSASQKILERGGVIVWNYGRIISDRSNTERRRFLSSGNIKQMTHRERIEYLTRSHRTYIKKPFVSRSLDETADKMAKQFKNTLGE